jgi:hypothetical protein
VIEISMELWTCICIGMELNFSAKLYTPLLNRCNF